MTGDLFTGWHDNQTTQHRERWDNGEMGMHAHRRCIESNNPWPALREPWGTNPDVPHQAELAQ